MKGLIATTAQQRTLAAKIVARLNARDGYPKACVVENPGTAVFTAAQLESPGYGLMTHPTRTAERLLPLHSPRMRAAWDAVVARALERIAAGTADADDAAIAALVEVDVPVDWFPSVRPPT